MVLIGIISFWSRLVFLIRNSWEALPNVETSLMVDITIKPQKSSEIPMVKIPAPLSSDRDRDVVRCDGLLFFGGLLDGNGLTKLFMVRMLKDHCENKFKKKL